MWRDAVLIAGKDLRIELRSRVAMNQVVPFAVVVLMLFGLAVGPNPQALSAAAAGLFWSGVLFSSVLAVQRSFAIESSSEARDGLRLLGVDPGGIFLGKAGAIVVELLVLEVLLAVVSSFLYGVHLEGALMLFASCAVATVGLAAIGTIYGALSIGTRVRETLLPMLVLPVAAPVLIAATKAWQEALAGSPSRGLGWLMVLGVVAVSYVAIGSVVFGPLLEDR